MILGDKIISKTYKQPINPAKTGDFEKKWAPDTKIKKEELQFSATILFLLLSLKVMRFPDVMSSLIKNY